MKLSLKLLAIIFLGGMVYACSMNKEVYQPPKTESPKVKPLPKEPEVVNSNYVLKLKNGAKIRVEIDYTKGEKGYVENGCSCNYYVTNISDIKVEKFCKIYFEYSTNDGKLIEDEDKFWDELLPRKTSTLKRSSIRVGKDKFCTSVKALRTSK